MTKPDDYGKAAVNSVNEFKPKPTIKDTIKELKDIWKNKSGHLSKSEDCPMSTFLELCTAGLVKGVPKRNYIKLRGKDTNYGEIAVKLLKADPKRAGLSEIKLWELVLEDCNKPGLTYNFQMNVVLGLWNNNLIV